jgi:iron(III) transport system ATP-binding protein
LPDRRRTGRYLSIRPQDIRLSVDNPKALNTFPGRVKETQINGVWIEHRVAVHRAELRACELNTSTGRRVIHPGDRLYVTLPPDSIAVLEA